MPTSSSVEFWQAVIDAFYAKYDGLAAWHKSLILSVGSTGRYDSISGRVYKFSAYRANNGEYKLPRTKILNYPVQGLGADIVMLSRISVRNRMLLLPEMKSKLVNTVHDDIWIDCPKKELDKDAPIAYNILSMIESVFKDLPTNFERAFKVPFNLPLRYELKTLTGEQLT